MSPIPPSETEEKARLRRKLALLKAELRRRERHLLRQKQGRARGMHRSLARRKLLPFIEWTHEDYEAGWFHRKLCARLDKFSEQVRRKESPRLLISAPPRHGKTAIVSQRFPDFHMARNPRHEVSVASYAQELADDNSRVAREVARSEEMSEVFPDIRPQRQKKTYYGDYKRQDVDKIGMWRVGNHASYKAVGVGGPLTGRGAHVLIIDDAFKDAAEAKSATRRQKVWDWYVSVARTRVSPGGGIIIMATRWDLDDLIGRLIVQAKADPAADQWEVMNFPAIATEDEEHRRAGESLHPERWPLEELLKLKNSLGAYWFSALFQGNPIPDGGNKVQSDWIGRYTADPFQLAREADQVWITSDTAQKAGANNDLHSIQVWTKLGARYYLLDRQAGRMEYPAYEAAMDAMRLKWHNWLTGLLIEDNSNGATYLQVRRAQGMLHDFSPTRDTPGKDKSKRARFKYFERAASGRQIFIPAADHPQPGLGPNAQEWMVFVCAFPAEPDDDADAASQLIMRLELEAREDNEGSSMDDFMEDFGIF